MAVSHKRSKSSRTKFMKNVNAVEPLEMRVDAIENTIKEWNKNESEKDELKKELATCKRSLNEVENELGIKRRKLSEAKYALNTIEENFQCIVCKSVPKGGCVVFPCCKQFGTCCSCIREWLQESDTCPHCRAHMEIELCTVLPESTN